MKYALDAGHGMSNRTAGVYDPGASHNGRQEHTIVTGMAYRVRNRLLEAYQEVLLIESGYVGARDNAAAAWGAQRYLALHCDANDDETATGTSVWVNRGASVARKAEAERLGKAVAAAMGIRWRGVSEKDFAVLSGKQPDMLLELFFISNPNDLKAFDANVLKVENAITAFLLGWGVPAPAPAPAPEVYYWMLAHVDYDTAKVTSDKLDAAGKAVRLHRTDKSTYSQIDALVESLP